MVGRQQTQCIQKDGKVDGLRRSFAANRCSPELTDYLGTLYCARLHPGQEYNMQLAQGLLHAVIACNNKAGQVHAQVTRGASRGSFACEHQRDAPNQTKKRKRKAYLLNTGKTSLSLACMPLRGFGPEGTEAVCMQGLDKLVPRRLYAHRSNITHSSLYVAR